MDPGSIGNTNRSWGKNKNSKDIRLNKFLEGCILVVWDYGIYCCEY